MLFRREKTTNRLANDFCINNCKNVFSREMGTVDDEGVVLENTETVVKDTINLL